MDVITTHVNADFDCLGAMIAARKLYPEAEMVFAGAQEKGLRDFLLRSTVYAYGFKRIKDIDLQAITRLILVDVRQSERIGPFAEVAARPGVDIHIYDHHPEGQSDLRGSVEVIEPVGSTVTVLARLFKQRGIAPTAEEATMMMLGLYEDTGSLLFSSTTGSDLEAAAFLLGHGANLNTVADFLTRELTAEQVAVLHELITSRMVLNVNGVDISVATASADHFVGDLSVLAHKLKDMESLDALIVAARLGDRIFLVGRSRIPEVNVGEILGEFGGGGHAYAASGTLRDMTLVQFLQRLPQVLKTHVSPRFQARHLMSHPVKTIARSARISEVRELLTRYNLNAVPVMEGREMVGIISRQVAEKAAHHRLAGAEVGDYMLTEFHFVAPGAAIEEIKGLMVERNQRFVPVLEEGLLVGVITRSDMLRHLVAGGRRSFRSEFQIDETGQGLARKQVVRLLRDVLTPRVGQLLHDLGDVGDELDFEVFAVGGFVRDLLLHKDNTDIDIVVEGDGIAFAEKFAARHGCRIRAHHKFGTSVIIFPDGFKIDVASARLEYYIEPGALPSVEHASIKLDLYRRDFTINTLALSLNKTRFGELLDFFQAQRDLKEKSIRVLHNLSFVEDPTRVFRAIRFEQRLGFSLGKHTAHLLQSAVRMGFLNRVGGARVFNELHLLFKEPNPLPAILRLEELDLLKIVHPGLTKTTGLVPLFEQASRALHWFDLLYTGDSCKRWVVYFLCLVSELDQDGFAEVCTRLDIPGRHRRILLEQREQSHTVLNLMEKRRARRGVPKPSEIYRLLAPLDTEVLLYLMARARTEECRRWISNYCTHLRPVTTALNGKDLAELGLPPGPRYKEVLAALLDARLNGQVLTRNDEISLVRRRYLKTS